MPPYETLNTENVELSVNVSIVNSDGLRATRLTVRVITRVMPIALENSWKCLSFGINIIKMTF